MNGAYEMTRENYADLKMKRLKEREERFRKELERIEEQKRKLEQRKRAEAERRMRIKAELQERKRQRIDKQKRAMEAITSLKTALKEVEEKTNASLYVPDIIQRINEALTEADRSLNIGDYDKVIELSQEIEELVKKARLEASKRAEEKRRRREKEAKYFYCIIPFTGEKSFGNIGMNNGEVYTIPQGDIAAVVCDSPMMDYELAEDDIRRHEAVLRRVMEEHTLVPVEFGTTIQNERILRHLMRKAYGTVKECLGLLDNMVELGAKAVLDGDNVVEPEERKEYASDILTSLDAKAKQAVLRDLFSDRLILNASFLVRRGDIDAFSNEVTKLQEKYPMLKLLYSGPWAPYNFVRIKIGTKGMEVAKK